jgi:hypothetical protein
MKKILYGLIAQWFFQINCKRKIELILKNQIIWSFSDKKVKILMCEKCNSYYPIIIKKKPNRVLFFKKFSSNTISDKNIFEITKFNETFKIVSWKY